MSESRSSRAPAHNVAVDARDPAGGGDHWRREFPYHWDADELVSRRQLLHVTVYTSGALFTVTALLALLGLVRKPRPTTARPIARVEEVATGQAVYFHYPEPDDEAVLLRRADGQFVAFSQKCTHLSCAVYYQGNHDRLYCPCHDGVFNAATGDPEAGPPQRRLPRILLRQEGDMLYAIGRES